MYKRIYIEAKWVKGKNELTLKYRWYNIVTRSNVEDFKNWELNEQQSNLGFFNYNE